MIPAAEIVRPAPVQRAEKHGPLSGAKAEVSLQPASVLEKKVAVADLHDRLVMMAPDPSQLPDAARIDREMRELAARAKDPAIRGLVADVVGTAISASGGTESISFVHEITSVNKPLHELRSALTTKKSGKKPQTLDSLVETFTYLERRGEQEPEAIDRAKELLFAYADTLLTYNPEFLGITSADAEHETRNAVAVSNGKRLKEGSLFGKLSFKRPSVVIDGTGAHEQGVPVEKINVYKPAVEGERTIIRDGKTTAVRIETIDDQPLEYALSVLVKEDDGTWRPIHLAPPVNEADYDPARHVPAQRKSVWTTDLPADKRRYAIVGEATPWHQDTDIKVDGGTIHTAFTDNEGDKEGGDISTAVFIDGIRAAGLTLSSVFYTDGAGKGQAVIKSYGAQALLDRLTETDQQFVLGLPLDSFLQGKANFTRLSLSYSARVGFLGDTSTMPLSVLVENGTTGHELMQSVSKPGDPETGGKTVASNEEEVSDRRAIFEALGIDGDDGRTEVFVYDHATTHRTGRRTGGATVTATTESRSHIFLQPVAPHESGDGRSNQRTMIELVPFLGKSAQSRVFKNPVSIVTVGDMLRYAADGSFGKPILRIDSPQLVEELKAEEAILEARRAEQARRTAALFGGGMFGADTLVRRMGGTDLGYGFGYTGVSTAFGEQENRGDSHVKSVDIIGQLPAAEVAATAKREIPPPPRIKNSVRRQYQGQE